MERKFNIAIVGSGLTGNITSLALAKAGYKIALIDPKSFENFQKKSYDTRTTALSKKSKLIAYESSSRFYEIGSFDGLKDFKNLINKNYDL